MLYFLFKKKDLIDIQSSLKKLEKKISCSLNIPKIQYQNNRFESFFETSKKHLKDKKYDQALKQASIYFNKTFGYNYKGISLMREIYTKLGDKEHEKMYECIEGFCESMLGKNQGKVARKRYTELMRYVRTHPDDYILQSFDIAYKFTTQSKKIHFSDSIPQDILFYTFTKVLYFLKKGEKTKSQEYLLQQDFYKKPTLLLITLQRESYKKILDIFQYEEIFDARQKYISTYHAAYIYLSSNHLLLPLDRLYFTIKLLQYTPEKIGNYTGIATLLFFEGRGFRKKSSIQELGILFGKDIQSFFESLYVLHKNRNKETQIKKILKKYNKIHHKTKITKTDLILFIYEIVKKGKTEEQLYKVLSQNRVERLFIKHIPELSTYKKNYIGNIVTFIKTITKKYDMNSIVLISISGIIFLLMMGMIVFIFVIKLF